MDLKPLSPELEELRNAIISSNLTSCYLVLDELISSRGERLFYDKFRKEWLDVYKEIYDRVSKMKTRKSSRGDAEIMRMTHRGPKRITK
ncbi:MAG: hypothetical protein ABSB22_26710 [Thermodesulfobacteriota bacterium]|jgi:hypothetical protein